jgi:hypothetical protein
MRVKLELEHKVGHGVENLNLWRDVAMTRDPGRDAILLFYEIV